MNPHEKLSENFRLSELTRSDTATRLGIDNTPNEEQLENLRMLANQILQPTRDHWGSLNISSGFRCLGLNRELRSEDTSQHLSGEAADMEKYGVDNYVLACWIRDNLEFDQLILEFYTSGDPSSGWVHVSNKASGNRNQCLTINKGTVKRGLVK